MTRTTNSALLASPFSVIVLLLIANTIEFLVLLRAGGSASIPIDVLVSHGALTSSAFAAGEYWRFVAYGFLHGNPTHLLLNMVSLLACGPSLERRLGVSAFIVVYCAGLVAAGAASALIHQGPFVTVGASGAIFGILGALFALWILGETELSPQFFAANLALNFAFAIRDPRVDWAAHLGGFIAGVTCCGLLDLAAKTNRFRLRCKFPEFVKANVLFLSCALGAFLWRQPPEALFEIDPRIIAVGWFIATIVLIFALDHLLAARKGLAWTIIVLAICNALAICSMTDLISSAATRLCDSSLNAGDFSRAVFGRLCALGADTTYVAPSSAFLLTLTLYAQPLRRGLRDVGFIGATLVADRQRQRRL